MSEFSLVIGRWKNDKQARHVRGCCIDSFKFFSLDGNNSKHIFSAILHLLFRASNPLYIKISENKNNFKEQSEAEIAKKITNSPASAESYWFLLKKADNYFVNSVH